MNYKTLPAPPVKPKFNLKQFLKGNSIFANVMLISFSLYLFAYIITVFYNWNFYNPLWWIPMIAVWPGGTRLGLLLLFTFLYTGHYLIAKWCISGKDDHGTIGVVCYIMAGLTLGIMTCLMHESTCNHSLP